MPYRKHLKRTREDEAVMKAAAIVINLVKIREKWRRKRQVKVMTVKKTKNLKKVSLVKSLVDSALQRRRIKAQWKINKVKLSSNSQKTKLEERFRKRNRKFRQTVDTNVVSIGFNILEEDAQLAAGDAIFCLNWKGVFNKYSKLCEPSDEKALKSHMKEDVKEEEDMKGNKLEKIYEDVEVVDEGELIWLWEFCYTRNIVNVDKEEVPTEESVNYILEIDEMQKNKSQSDVSVIFWLDVSGSMWVTTPVEGKVKIKGDRLKELQELMKFSDGSDQFFKESRNTTYISRLQCVQAAIESQIMDFSEKAPNKKIGFVTFNQDVNIVGDGSEMPLVVSGDKLTDYEFLKKNGIDSTDTHMKKCIGEVQEELINKLYQLEECGPTALGPALLTAVAMASQGSAGSSVVIWTDGLSNVGLGAIEGKSEESVLEFYNKVADFAHENGVTVNIISIAGEECDLETLRIIPERTGGDVTRVEAAKLTENFANILKSPIIATNVNMKIILHKGLEFRNEENDNLNAERNIFTKEMGNVTAESEVTFEYKVKDIEELEKANDYDINKLEQLPFQSQIQFTKLDGMRWIRVVTKVQLVSNDRKEVEAEANADVLGVNWVQQAAKLARRGSFRKAQAYMKNQKRYWDNNDNEEARKEIKSNLVQMNDTVVDTKFG